MNRFCKRVLLFSIPLLLGLLAIHLYIEFTPSMFRNKACYIENNKENIEVIFLGSSHTQDAINPLLMKNACSNLAYNLQDIVTNCMLFDKYVEELPKLKFVVFEFEYFTLEQPLHQSEIYAPLYRKFHNLPQTSLYNQLTSIFTGLPFFNTYIYENWKLKRDDDYDINNSGFVTQSAHNPFGEFNHDSTLIYESAKIRLTTRHKARYIEDIEPNTLLLDSFIAKAKARNIEVIFLALPKYKTYIEREIPDKLARRNLYLNQKLRNKEVLYFDYKNDSEFKDVNLFSDDNHLNRVGAKKFTLIIDSLISGLKQKSIPS